MTYPTGFAKVVLSGTALGGSEIWSTSFSVLPPFTSGSRVEELRSELLPRVVQGASNWIGRASSLVHPSCQLRTVKVNMVDREGRYLSEDETVFADIAAGAARGSSGGPMLPPQSTLALTLRTDAARGLANRGRMFSPHLSATLDTTTGGVSDSDAAGAATSLVSFLDYINGLDGYSVVVASKVREGAIRPVTRVEVGSVVDTQRRRRSALPEKYSGVDLAT